jgi:hypothetical protein
MEGNKYSLYRATGFNAAVQLLALVICTAVSLLFAALTYAEITLPEYTAAYAQKDVQQVICTLSRLEMQSD